uniref:Uncharacterized protein n=1 Tax=viral metagenome TaxID=1070528 RepID=A0A6M3J8M4_9ZZZZ
MSLFSKWWGPAYYYVKATKAFDAWWAMFWKPTMDVVKMRVEIDVYVCGSEQAAKEKFKEVNGHYPDASGFGGFTAGNQLYLVSAFRKGKVILNPLTVGHEIIEYLDGRYAAVVEADDYVKSSVYDD